MSPSNSLTTIGSFDSSTLLLSEIAVFSVLLKATSGILSTVRRLDVGSKRTGKLLGFSPRINVMYAFAIGLITLSAPGARSPVFVNIRLSTIGDFLSFNNRRFNKNIISRTVLNIGVAVIRISLSPSVV